MLVLEYMKCHCIRRGWRQPLRALPEYLPRLYHTGAWLPDSYCSMLHAIRIVKMCRSLQVQQNKDRLSMMMSELTQTGVRPKSTLR